MHPTHGDMRATLASTRGCSFERDQSDAATPSRVATTMFTKSPTSINFSPKSIVSYGSDSLGQDLNTRRIIMSAAHQHELCM